MSSAPNPSTAAGAIEAPDLVHEAFAKIARRYVVANHVLSLGTDILWRRKVARRVAAEVPREILDVATGTGDLAAEIQSICPGCRIVGSDFCAPMLEVARERGLTELLVADALDLPFEDQSFDVVTVAFGLRNMSSWPGALAEMARVLRPGGCLFILDFSLPEGFLREPYRFYLQNVLPRIAGMITGQRAAFEYLAKSIHLFPSGEAMNELVRSAGFDDCEDTPLSFGIAAVYCARKAGP